VEEGKLIEVEEVEEWEVEKILKWKRKKDLENVKEVVTGFEGRMSIEVRRQDII